MRLHRLFKNLETISLIISSIGIVGSLGIMLLTILPVDGDTHAVPTGLPLALLCLGENELILAGGLGYFLRSTKGAFLQLISGILWILLFVFLTMVYQPFPFMGLGYVGLFCLFLPGILFLVTGLTRFVMYKHFAKLLPQSE